MQQPKGLAMSESLIERDIIIFNEMMTHPVLFTHPHPKKTAVISNDASILQEILKHQSVAEAWQVTEDSPTKPLTNSKAHYYAGDLAKWIKVSAADTFDVIIIATPFTATHLKSLFTILHHDGILIQQAGSPFECHAIKKMQDTFHAADFHDVQLLQFPQPNYASGWRCALMAKKHGAFRRIREKDVFNKSFTTDYYNFDVHNAALAIPEFMRKELAI